MIAEASKSGVMIRALVSNYHQMGLTVVGLLIFLTVFCGVLIQVFRSNQKSYYEKMSRVPFE